MKTERERERERDSDAERRNADFALSGQTAAATCDPNNNDITVMRMSETKQKRVNKQAATKVNGEKITENRGKKPEKG